jgi:iron complex transport system substrate-binding protein
MPPGWLHAVVAALLLAWTPVTTAADAVPRRVITLSPHATELVFQLGAGDRMVGTVEYSDYPDDARRLPRVGGYNTISLEQIATLRPDLVVTWPSGNPPAILDALARQNIPVFATDPQHLGDITSDLRALGRRLGVADKGVQEAGALEARLQALRNQHATARPVGVFYEVWDTPLYTLGGQHFFNDLLSVCGGVNVFADTRMPSPVVSMETVVARNPEVILSGGRDGGQNAGDWKAGWQRWKGLKAVSNGHLYQVNPDIFTRPTGRVAEAATSLCSLLDAARTPQ